MIVNNQNSFKNIVEFLKEHFKNVKIIDNKNSEFASRSQNFYRVILFENRGSLFSIKWNYYNCTLFFGDITKEEKTSFQYSFTKMKLDYFYPIEIGNNFNVMFWTYEITHPHDDMPEIISPFRLPVCKEN